MKVLLTRAEDQAGDLRERIIALGCEVIEFPLIEIVDPPDGGVALERAMRAAASPANPYAWIVLTSPNAAKRALRHLAPRATTTRIGANVGANIGARIAAIGAGTAAVCAALGFPVDLIPDRAVGEGLVEAFPAFPAFPTFPAGSSGDVGAPSAVLIPRAETARDVIPNGLRAKGWKVDVVVAYRTIALRPDPSQCDLARLADVAVLTSSSTARALVAALGTPLPMVVSIGPQTTATLESLGAHVHVAADPHTLDGIVAALALLARLADGPI